MAANNFSVGRDVTAVLITGDGYRVDFTGITGFDMKPKHKVARSDRLNAFPLEKHIPDGWDGTFDVDRYNGANDQYFTQQELGWWATGSANGGAGMTGMLTVYTTEVDRSQTIEQWGAVCVWLEDRGAARSDSPMKQRIGVHAGYKAA